MDGDGFATATTIAGGGSKALDPEKTRVSEIFKALSDIFAAEVSGDQLQFFIGIANHRSSTLVLYPAGCARFEM